MNKNIKLASICLFFLSVGLMTGCGTGGLRGADAEVEADIERCAQFQERRLLNAAWNGDTAQEQADLCVEAGCFWRTERLGIFLEAFWKLNGTCISLLESCDQFEDSSFESIMVVHGGMTAEQACELSPTSCEVLDMVGHKNKCVDKGTLVTSTDRPEQAICDKFSAGIIASLDPVGCHNAGCVPFDDVFGRCLSYKTSCADAEDYYQLCDFLPGCEWKAEKNRFDRVVDWKCFDKAS